MVKEWCLFSVRFVLFTAYPTSVALCQELGISIEIHQLQKHSKSTIRKYYKVASRELVWRVYLQQLFLQIFFNGILFHSFFCYFLKTLFHCSNIDHANITLYCTCMEWTRMNRIDHKIQFSDFSLRRIVGIWFELVPIVLSANCFECIAVNSV